ncbi:MAG: TMEM175 family protein [Gammaproteobacteria bacterium]|nr:TMEM175 family protein [Gammaproteobacteria bacterium]
MSINTPFDEKRLAECPVENGFRLRGVEMTRIEVFVDAAFAFALTMLVISGDSVPHDFGELLDAFKGVPTFAATFLILMLFWFAHRNWSRRFGIEDVPVMWMSGFFVFVMLVWVYPLRMVFSGMFEFFSGGLLPSNVDVDSYFELRALFATYAVGFLLLSLTIIGLNRHALKLAEPLRLDAVERHDARAEIVGWAVPALVSLVSLLFALLMPENLIPLAGWVYFVLAITGPLLGWQQDRQRERLRAPVRESGEETLPAQ